MIIDFQEAVEQLGLGVPDEQTMDLGEIMVVPVLTGSKTLAVVVDGEGRFWKCQKANIKKIGGKQVIRGRFTEIFPIANDSTNVLGRGEYVISSR